MNSARVTRYALLLVLTAMSFGCVNFQVDLAYRPEGGHKSPLSTIKPLVFAIQVDDQRNPKERDRLTWIASVKANRDVVLVLHEALKTELENNGHNVRALKDADVNATVHFVLKKYWCCDSRFFGYLESPRWIATINGDLEILDAKNERLVSKPVSSTYLRSGQTNRDERLEIPLNGVLSEFIRNWARDPSIVNALQGIQREKHK